MRLSQSWGQLGGAASRRAWPVVMPVALMASRAGAKRVLFQYVCTCQ